MRASTFAAVACIRAFLILSRFLRSCLFPFVALMADYGDFNLDEFERDDGPSFVHGDNRPARASNTPLDENTVSQEDASSIPGTPTPSNASTPAADKSIKGNTLYEFDIW